MSNLVLDSYVPCDAPACPARSYVVVRLAPAPARNAHVLAFCAHHYAEHATMLRVQGWDVIEDTRADLAPMPAPTNDDTPETPDATPARV